MTKIVLKIARMLEVARPLKTSRGLKVARALEVTDYQVVEESAKGAEAQTLTILSQKFSLLTLLMRQLLWA